MLRYTPLFRLGEFSGQFESLGREFSEVSSGGERGPLTRVVTVASHLFSRAPQSLPPPLPSQPPRATRTMEPEMVPFAGATAMLKGSGVCVSFICPPAGRKGRREVSQNPLLTKRPMMRIIDRMKIRSIIRIMGGMDRRM